MLAAHELKMVALAAASTVAALDADAFVSNIPGLALGTLGFVTLVWRLVKDNTADEVIRGGYATLVEAERARADRAEERTRKLEERVAQLEQINDDEGTP